MPTSFFDSIHLVITYCVHFFFIAVIKIPRVLCCSGLQPSLEDG
jgi:hypothetical protein